MFYVFLYFSILTDQRDPAADIIVLARERIKVWTSPRHHYIPLGLRGCLWIAVNGNYFYSLLPKKPHFQANISSNQWLLAFSTFHYGWLWRIARENNNKFNFKHSPPGSVGTFFLTLDEGFWQFKAPSLISGRVVRGFKCGICFELWLYF